MTFVWFVIWLIANNVGRHEPLDLNPSTRGSQHSSLRWRLT
jgi:hypothetical protein